MATKRKWTVKNISQLLGESEDEHRDTDSSILDANDDVKINFISKMRDDALDEFLDELSLAQDSVNEHYLSKNKKDIWHSLLISPSTGRT